jgi:hypothetical protein
LRILYRDPTLGGGAVTRNLRVAEDGIYTTIYGKEWRYLYKQLFVYNVAKKELHEIGDVETARGYFATFNPDYSSGCPEAHEGIGERIF